MNAEQMADMLICTSGDYHDAAEMLRAQAAAIKTLRDALDYIVIDLEIRAVKGIVTIGNGAYVQAKAALAATEKL